MDKKNGLIVGEIIADMAQRIYSNRRVTTSLTEVTEDVMNIMDVIRLINSQPENTTRIMDRNIDEFVVPQEFKDFVLPNSVRYDVGNRSSKDLLVRSGINKIKVTYNTYLNSISRLRSVYRKGSQEDLVNLSDLRKDYSFEDVRSRASYDNLDYYKTNYEGLPFIPIRLTDGYQFFEDYHFNMDDIVPVKDYINTLNN